MNKSSCLLLLIFIVLKLLIEMIVLNPCCKSVEVYGLLLLKKNCKFSLFFQKKKKVIEIYQFPRKNEFDICILIDVFRVFSIIYVFVGRKLLEHT